MDNEKIGGSFCDEVRYAVSFGEELTEEMKKHLEDCAECRTFLEQNEKMIMGLESLNIPTFEKNGMTLADSVMAEIKSQSVFTSGKPVKSRAFVRHAGLIAACLILLVMAAPVMNSGLKGAQSADSVNDEDVIHNAEVYSIANGANIEESKALQDYNYSNVNQYSLYADEEACEAELADGAEAETETADDVSKKKSVAYDTVEETQVYNSEMRTESVTGATTTAQMPMFAASGGAEPQSPAEFTEEAGEQQNNVYGVAETAAQSVCEYYGITLDKLISLEYSGETDATAVFSATTGEQITLQLKNDGDGWTVLISEIHMKN